LTVPGKVAIIPLSVEGDFKAEISVLVRDVAFTFSVSALDSWLAPQLSILVNDKAVVHR
jgi:hypothetical protein